jgi:hypothetical protein
MSTLALVGVASSVKVLRRSQSALDSFDQIQSLAPAAEALPRANGQDRKQAKLPSLPPRPKSTALCDVENLVASQSRPNTWLHCATAVDVQNVLPSWPIGLPVARKVLDPDQEPHGFPSLYKRSGSSKKNAIGSFASRIGRSLPPGVLENGVGFRIKRPVDVHARGRNAGVCRRKRKVVSLESTPMKPFILLALLCTAVTTRAELLLADKGKGDVRYCR